MGSSYYEQMHKHQAFPPSKLSTSGHSATSTNTSNSNSSSSSRSIATNTAKVLNKINTLVRPPESFLKTRPYPRRTPPPPPPPPPPAERFQIVHTPDRASDATRLWDIPRTDAEYRAALEKMKTQEQLRRGGGQGRQEAGASAPGVRAASYDRFPSSSGYAGGSAEDAQPRVMRGERDASPGRTPASPSYADHGSPGLVSSTYSLSLEGAGFARTRVGGLTTSSSTPTVTVSTPTSARFPQRVLSVDVLRAPRPLSERALIPLGPRAGRGEQAPEMTTDTSSTQVVSRAVTPRSSSANMAEDAGGGRTAADPGIRARRRKTRRMRSIVSVAADDGEDAAENGKPGVPSARKTRAWTGFGAIHDRGSVGPRGPGMTDCYVCQEPCKPGAGLCGECKSRFQPLGEVFEDSESEYEDDLVDVPRPAPKQSPPVRPATPPGSERRGDSISPRVEAEESSLRGSSGQSSASKRSGDPASRSTSVSPTPHLAHNMQLKVVPYPMIRKVSVSSPVRERDEHRRSALYHIQQTMKPREPMTPGAAPGQGRDAIRVGRVHSGEVKFVVEHNDGPDERVDSPRHRSGSSYGDWFRYYEKVKEDAEGGEYVSEHYELVSPITNSDLFNNYRNRASAESSTYDLIYSIYNEYCDQQEDAEHGGMF